VWSNTGDYRKKVEDYQRSADRGAKKGERRASLFSAGVFNLARGPGGRGGRSYLPKAWGAG